MVAFLLRSLALSDAFASDTLFLTCAAWYFARTLNLLAATCNASGTHASRKILFVSGIRDETIDLFAV